MLVLMFKGKPQMQKDIFTFADNQRKKNVLVKEENGGFFYLRAHWEVFLFQNRKAMTS